MTDVPPDNGAPDAQPAPAWDPSGIRRSNFTPAPPDAEPPTFDDDALADAMAAEVSPYTSEIKLPHLLPPAGAEFGGPPLADAAVPEPVSPAPAPAEPEPVPPASVEFIAPEPIAPEPPAAVAPPVDLPAPDAATAQQAPPSTPPAWSDLPTPSSDASAGPPRVPEPVTYEAAPEPVPAPVADVPVAPIPLVEPARFRDSGPSDDTSPVTAQLGQGADVSGLTAEENDLRRALGGASTLEAMQRLEDEFRRISNGEAPSIEVPAAEQPPAATADTTRGPSTDVFSWLSTTTAAAPASSPSSVPPTEPTPAESTEETAAPPIDEPASTVEVAAVEADTIEPSAPEPLVDQPPVFSPPVYAPVHEVADAVVPEPADAPLPEAPPAGGAWELPAPDVVPEPEPAPPAFGSSSFEDEKPNDVPPPERDLALPLPGTDALGWNSPAPVQAEAEAEPPAEAEPQAENIAPVVDDLDTAAETEPARESALPASLGTEVWSLFPDEPTAESVADPAADVELPVAPPVTSAAPWTELAAEPEPSAAPEAFAWMFPPSPTQATPIDEPVPLSAPDEQTDTEGPIAFESLAPATAAIPVISPSTAESEAASTPDPDPDADPIAEPEPEQQTVPEPEPVQIAEPEPEQIVEPEPEPLVEPEQASEPEPETLAEPVPEPELAAEPIAFPVVIPAASGFPGLPPVDESLIDPAAAAAAAAATLAASIPPPLPTPPTPEPWMVADAPDDGVWDLGTASATPPSESQPEPDAQPEPASAVEAESTPEPEVQPAPELHPAPELSAEPSSGAADAVGSFVLPPVEPLPPVQPLPTAAPTVLPDASGSPLIAAVPYSTEPPTGPESPDWLDAPPPVYTPPELVEPPQFGDTQNPALDPVSPITATTMARLPMPLPTDQPNFADRAELPPPPGYEDIPIMSSDAAAQTTTVAPMFLPPAPFDPPPAPTPPVADAPIATPPPAAPPAALSPFALSAPLTPSEPLLPIPPTAPPLGSEPEPVTDLETDAAPSVEPGNDVPLEAPPAVGSAADAGTESASLDEDDDDAIDEIDRVNSVSAASVPLASIGAVGAVTAVGTAAPVGTTAVAGTAVAGTAVAGTATLDPALDPAEDSAPVAPVAVAPAAPVIETSGLEPTPLELRTGRAARLFWLWFAANSSVVSMGLGAVLLGTGMSLRQSIVATLAGVAISFLPLGLGTLAGKWSGQPTMVVSRATFGHAGNILPALLAVITRVFWGGVLLWVLATAVAQVLVGAGLDGGLGATVWQLIGLVAGFVIVTVFAVVGYRLVAKLQFVLSIVNGLLILGAAALTFQHLDFARALTVPDGSWILAIGGAVIVFSVIGLAWVHSSSDLARYQRPGSSGGASMLWATFGATLPPFLLICWGAILAASDAKLAAAMQVNPLAAIATLLPSWYPAPLLAAAALGLLSGAVLTIYSGGFALQAVGLRIRRTVSTLTAAILVLAFAAALLFVVTDFASVVQGIIITIAVPVAAWAGIFAAEMMIRTRRFHTPSLLAPGGVYPQVRWPNLIALIVVSAIGYGFVASNVVGLQWEGFFFTLIGVAPGDPFAASNVGVFIALVLGLLVPLATGISVIRRQEADDAVAVVRPGAPSVVAAPLVVAATGETPVVDAVELEPIAVEADSIDAEEVAPEPVVAEPVVVVATDEAPFEQPVQTPPTTAIPPQ